MGGGLYAPTDSDGEVGVQPTTCGRRARPSTERGAYIRMRSGNVIDSGNMSFEHLASILGHELS